MLVVILLSVINLNVTMPNVTMPIFYDSYVSSERLQQQGINPIELFLEKI